jgi:hypothetical protein
MLISPGAGAHSPALFRYDECGLGGTGKSFKV